MGPGSESQRDHNLRTQSVSNRSKNPANKAFAGFFVLEDCQKTSKFSKSRCVIRAGKIVFMHARSNFAETVVQQGVQNLNMPFQRSYEW